MEYTISLGSVIGLGFLLLMGVLLSFGVFAYIRIRHKAKALPFFAGCLMTFVAGFMLMQIVHIVVLSGKFGEIVENNIWVYSLYFAVASALVEESCRLWTYRSMLRKKLDNDYNAMMFGAGQGGGEAIWMLTISMAANYLVAVTIYQGHSDYFFQELTKEETQLTIMVLDQLTQKPPVEIFMMAVERIGYCVMHIAMAVIVFFSANKKFMDWKFYFIALGVRFGFQFVATLAPLLNLHCVASALIICAASVVCAVVAWKIWQDEHVDLPEPEPEPEIEEAEEEYEEPEYDEEEDYED